jgi:hypothetical protein
MCPHPKAMRRRRLPAAVNPERCRAVIARVRQSIHRKLSSQYHIPPGMSGAHDAALPGSLTCKQG